MTCSSGGKRCSSRVRSIDLECCCCMDCSYCSYQLASRPPYCCFSYIHFTRYTQPMLQLAYNNWKNVRMIVQMQSSLDSSSERMIVERERAAIQQPRY